MAATSGRRASGQRQRLRERARSAAQRRVREWVFGGSVLSWDDPGRRIMADATSYAPVRLVQSSPDDGHPVEVGRYSALHPTAAVFHGGNHRIDCVGVLNQRWEGGVMAGPVDGVPTSKGPVVIGNDVWVGYEALIMSGVRIGDGAVVAARSVVVKDVEPYQIVGGNPARPLGWRFEEPTREALLRIRWWDWPLDRATEFINSDDVDGFVARFDRPPVFPS